MAKFKSIVEILFNLDKTTIRNVVRNTEQIVEAANRAMAQAGQKASSTPAGRAGAGTALGAVGVLASMTPSTKQRLVQSFDDIQKTINNVAAARGKARQGRLLLEMSREDLDHQKQEIVRAYRDLDRTLGQRVAGGASRALFGQAGSMRQGMANTGQMIMGSMIGNLAAGAGGLAPGLGGLMGGIANIPRHGLVGGLGMGITSGLAGLMFGGFQRRREIAGSEISAAQTAGVGQMTSFRRNRGAFLGGAGSMMTGSEAMEFLSTTARSGLDITSGVSTSAGKRGKWNWSGLTSGGPMNPVMAAQDAAAGTPMAMGAMGGAMYYRTKREVERRNRERFDPNTFVGPLGESEYKYLGTGAHTEEQYRYGRGTGSGAASYTPGKAAGAVGDVSLSRRMAAVHGAYGQGGLGSVSQMLLSLGQTGGNEAYGSSSGGVNRNAATLIGEAMGLGIVQGLSKSRRLEVISGVASLAQQAPIGAPVSGRGAVATMGMIGLAGRAFQGVRGVETAQILTGLASGRGGGLNQSMAMLSAGLGQGQDFFGARRGMQAAGAANPESIAKLMSTYQRLIPHSGVRQMMLSEATGGRITDQGFARLEDAISRSGGDQEKIMDEINKAMQDKSIEKEMLDLQKTSAGSLQKVNTTMDRLLEYTGGVVAPAMIKLMTTFASVAGPLVAFLAKNIGPIASIGGGAMLGSMFGPKGAVIGAAAGGLAYAYSALAGTDEKTQQSYQKDILETVDIAANAKRAMKRAASDNQMVGGVGGGGGKNEITINLKNQTGTNLKAEVASGRAKVNSSQGSSGEMAFNPSQWALTN